MIRLDEMTPIRRLCKELEIAQCYAEGDAKLDARVKEYFQSSMKKPKMMKIVKTEQLNYPEQAPDTVRRTYVFCEEIIPTLLESVKGHVLLPLSDYIEESNVDSYRVEVIKNRRNGLSVRESISDLLENGI